MNKISIRTLLLCLLLPYISQGQVGFDSLILKLQKSHFQGVIVGKTHFSKVLKLPQICSCYDGDHDYIWNKNNLTTMIDGTGVLFEYQNEKSSKRIDSTCYYGYNYGAFNFSYNDTIFSWGGYGFWQFNGMLRYFDEKTGGWDVIPTLGTVPIQNLAFSKTYYDVLDKKVYAFYIKAKPHYYDPSKAEDKTLYIQCLDLVTKKIWDEPKICNKDVFADVGQYIITGTINLKQGMLVRNERTGNIYDFKNNRLLKFKTTKDTELEKNLNNEHDYLLFTQDSSILVYNPTNGNVDTIKYNSSDIISTGQQLYNSKNTTIGYLQQPLFFAGTLVGLIVVGIFIWLFISNNKLKKRNEFLLNAHMTNNKKSETEVIVANSESFRENLTEVEKGLLDLLVGNTLKNEMTTINDMNQVLGIANKPTKVQNNIRSTTIQIINKKFSVYSGLSDDVIEKQRTQFDKRFFEYYIQKKYLTKLK